MNSHMRVFFLVAGDESMASTRYRILNTLPFLEESEIVYEIVTRGEVDSNLSLAYRLYRESFQSDVIYIQKSLFPPLYWLPPIFYKILSVGPADIVYDFDDALYTSRPWQDGIPTRSRIHLKSILSVASIVITGNPTLSEYARNYAEEVVCLPTPLPKKEYDKYITNASRTTDLVTMSWIGNTENLWYLYQFEDAISTALSNHDNLNFQLITDTADVNSLPFEEHRGNDVMYREWSMNKELNLLTNADFVIRPLTHDEWTKGKGGYTSVVQSMALGIPVIVSPVSMLCNLITHGESGFHAATEYEWTEYISELVYCNDKRSQMGKNARQKIDDVGLWTKAYTRAIINVIQFISGDSPNKLTADKYAEDIINCN